MAYSCCFSLGGNLDFPDFLQKRFYNIGCWVEKLEMSHVLQSNKCHGAQL